MSLRREEKQVKPGSDADPYRMRCAADCEKRSASEYVYMKYDGVALEVYVLSSRNQKWPRTIAGWLCLLTVAFMYAPLGGALLVAHGIDCCTGGYCKIPAHHHKRQNQQTLEQQASVAHSDQMNCEHEVGGMAMPSCSMTCCQDPSRPALLPVAFVLPAAARAPEPGAALWSVRPGAEAKISRFTTPLSPPPRSF